MGIWIPLSGSLRTRGRRITVDRVIKSSRGTASLNRKARSKTNMSAFILSNELRYVASQHVGRCHSLEHCKPISNARSRSSNERHDVAPNPRDTIDYLRE